MSSSTVKVLNFKTCHFSSLRHMVTSLDQRTDPTSVLSQSRLIRNEFSTKAIKRVRRVFMFDIVLM